MISLTVVGIEMLCKKCVKPYICEECSIASETVQPYALDKLTWLCKVCISEIKLN